MKPTKEQIKQYYSQALQRSLESYARLDEKEWGKKASSRWTAKDYLAHLVVTQEREGLIQQALAGQPGEIPGFDGRESINDYNERLLDGVRDGLVQIGLAKALQHRQVLFHGRLQAAQ